MNFWEQIHDKIEGYWASFVLSLPRIAVGLIILSFFVLLAVLISRFVQRRMKPEAVDAITINFVIRLIKIVFVVCGLILAFNAFGLENFAGGLLASAGFGAIVIGFAFKEIGENFLAGIILVFDRPFSIGDTVSVNGNMGNVVRLKFRTTQIKSFDGKDIFVPNGSVIRNDLYNYTRDGFLRIEFVVGVDYDDDLDQARQLIEHTVNSFPDVLRNEKTQVIVDEFATSTVNLKVMFWIDTFDYKVGVLEAKSQVMIAVKNVLLEHKFGLPANIQEFKLYRPDPIPVAIYNKANEPGA